MTDPSGERGDEGAPRDGATVPVTVRTDGAETTIRVPEGANLRRSLLAAGFDVYGPLSRRFNCGGRGLCATCGVCLGGDAPAPRHWHDRLAVIFGYPRLSCQVSVDRPLTVSLVDKLYWGQALPRRFDLDAERADAGVCRDATPERSADAERDATGE